MNCIATIALIASLSALSATEDTIGKDLGSAIEEFEDASEKAQKELIQELMKRAAKARTAGDLQMLERIDSELLEFEDTGKLPTAVLTVGFEREIRHARAKLEAAYENAIKEYTKTDQIALARATKEQLDELQKDNSNALYRLVAGGGAIRHFKNGGRAYANRKYVWTDVPEDLPMTKQFMIDGGGKESIKLDVKVRGWVFVALSEPDSKEFAEYLATNHWKRTEFQFRLTDREKTSMFVFRKRFPVGTVELPRLGWSGPLPLCQ